MGGCTKEDFFNFLTNKYCELTSIAPQTLSGIRVACRAVLTDVPDNSLTTDWDIDAILDQFLLNKTITDATKRAYISRVKSAVSKFIEYCNNLNNIQVKPIESEKTKFLEIYMQKKTIEKEITVKTFELPIPLRDETTLIIKNLPRDLTKEEARRISSIMDSYAVVDAESKK